MRSILLTQHYKEFFPCGSTEMNASDQDLCNSSPALKIEVYEENIQTLWKMQSCIHPQQQGVHSLKFHPPVDLDCQDSLTYSQQPAQHSSAAAQPALSAMSSFPMQSYCFLL